jgi:hypothetical protein
MTNGRSYYNEIDPYCAQWLRNLIGAGHIADGDVDERSIEDVRPDDVRGYTQCHFFAGVGVWSYALRLAGWPDDRPVWTGSCPCQPFSQAGKGAGFADERHLWPAWFHLIRECRPQSSLVSRFQALPQSRGLISFKTTWRQKATPSLRLISVLRASEHRFDGLEFSLWPTPTAVDGRRGHSIRPQDTGIPLPQTIARHLGLAQNSFQDRTGSAGSSNPQFSSWLMGIPTDLLLCAPSATRSRQKSRPSSSAPIAADA